MLFGSLSLESRTEPQGLNTVRSHHTRWLREMDGKRGHRLDIVGVASFVAGAVGGAFTAYALRFARHLLPYAVAAAVALYVVFLALDLRRGRGGTDG